MEAYQIQYNVMASKLEDAINRPEDTLVTATKKAIEMKKKRERVQNIIMIVATAISLIIGFSFRNHHLFAADVTYPVFAVVLRKKKDLK